MLRLSKSILVLLCASGSYAQNEGTLKGVLKDSSSNQKLSLATVAVYRSTDTSLLAYRLSNEQGEFRIPKIPINVDCRVIISFSGYKVFRQSFRLTIDDKVKDFGEIPISKDTMVLEQVLVYAEIPPITVREDTVEFNAVAFKTLPNALVEDLLKKLPGVYIDTKGNITYNGKSVRKILVDGKSFFGNDVRIATRNLPADIIDKVQVVDDKEQLERYPELTKNDVDQIINLKLKKGIKKGWFGKAYAGHGTDDRYEIGGIANLFRDTLQVSVLSYTNNLNRAGFGMSDLSVIGGFSRNGVYSGDNNTDGGVRLNGISFGGTDQGIQKSTGVGFNFNHDVQKKLGLNFYYFFGGINNTLKSVSTTQQFYGDTTFRILSSDQVLDRNKYHTLGSQMIWKLDDVSSLTIKPSLSISTLKGRIGYSSSNSNNKLGLINESFVDENSIIETADYALNASYDKRWKKIRKSIRISLSIDNNNRNGDYFIIGENNFYTGEPNIPLDQVRTTKLKGIGVYTSGAFTYPLSKKISFRTAMSFNYSKGQDQLNVYVSDTGKHEFNEDLSWNYDYGSKRVSVGNTILYSYKNKSITLGLVGIYINRKNDFGSNGGVVLQNYFFVVPATTFTWKGLNIRYSIAMTEPAPSDLRPVIDNKNPLFLMYGNPLLSPTVIHRVNSSWFKTQPKQLLNFNITANADFEQNTTVRIRTIDLNGIHTSRPANVRGLTKVNSQISVGKQLHFTNVKMNITPGVSFMYSEGLVFLNNLKSQVTTFGTSQAVSVGVNWIDKLELNQRVIFNTAKTSYTSEHFRSLSIKGFSSLFEAVVRLPKNWIWETSFEYLKNPNTIGFNSRRQIVKWNAAVNFLFLKNKKAHLRLSAYDILKMNSNRTVHLLENYYQETESTVLTNYYLLTFTYDLRDFRPRNIGGKGLFRF